MQKTGSQTDLLRLRYGLVTKDNLNENSDEPVGNFDRFRVTKRDKISESNIEMGGEGVLHSELI